MDNSQRYFLVAGLGVTGHSIARYLARKQCPFVMYDTRPHPTGVDEFRQEFPGVDVFLGDLPESVFESISEIISSPGVPLDSSFMLKASEKNIPIYGDIECLARETDAPVVAITGTNGKSTVTTLVGEMAKAAGISVAVAGNIGTPVLDLLDNGVRYDLWVLELSSFQLDLVNSLAPVAATILNISADHLDRHHTLQAYIDAKQRVYHQAHAMIYNRDDVQTTPSESGHSVVSYGLGLPEDAQWGLRVVDDNTYLAYGSHNILPVSALKLKGRHNWSNALAACALAYAAGIDFQCMVTVLTQFTGLPHRAQWVRTLDGVDWINDSKGTNIGATCSAILGIGESMQGKIVLIAGGLGKGADFSELRTPMADHVRTLVLIGEDADKMEKALSSSVKVLRSPSLEEAVRVAHQQAQPGDVVMLSPACASQDMFRDFNHRGEVFVAQVNAL